MIVVHSSVPELATTFNLPVVGYRLGTSNTNQSYNSTYATMSYTVSPEGCQVDEIQIGISPFPAFFQKDCRSV